MPRPAPARRSGSSRCSTACTRARNVATVSSRSTGTHLGGNHLAGVHALVDPVDRGGGLRHPGREDVLDRMRARELRQRRGVGVHDGAGVAVEERAPEQMHVPGENDEVDTVLAEPACQRGVARLASLVLRAVEDRRRDARRLRTGERRHAGHVRRDGRDRQLRVDQRLQVRSRA